MDVANQMGVLAEGFLFPIPPLALEQSTDRFVVKPVLDDPGWISNHNGIGRNGFRDNRSGSYHNTIGQMDTGKNNGSMANPNVISDLNIPLGVDPARWKPGIKGGRGTDCLMVMLPSRQEYNIFGNRTKLPDGY